MKFLQRNRTYPLSDFGACERNMSRGAHETVKQLRKLGHETYIVGGAVRDLVLGQHPKDFDVATAALPEQIRKIFGRKSRIIRSRFGLVQVRRGREIIEVSTFRAAPPKRKLRDGRILDDNTYGNNARDDVFRRDLTANGLLLDPYRKEIIDYVGGVDDLLKGRLSAIGDPKRRYQEDPVRMLRTLRLAAKLNLSVAPATATPISKMANMLETMPPRRLMAEVVKILNSGASQQAFALLDKYGLRAVLLPHMEKFGPGELEFVDLALARFDRLQRTEGKASINLAVTAMFWPAISGGFKCAHQDRLNWQQFGGMIHTTGTNESRLISRKIANQVHGLMGAMRALYHRYKTKRAALMLTPELKQRLLPEALAFEELRVAAGEADSDVLDWWRTLAEADASVVEAILENLPEQYRFATS